MGLHALEVEKSEPMTVHLTFDRKKTVCGLVIERSMKSKNHGGTFNYRLFAYTLDQWQEAGPSSFHCKRCKRLWEITYAESLEHPKVAMALLGSMKE